MMRQRSNRSGRLFCQSIVVWVDESFVHAARISNTRKASLEVLRHSWMQIDIHVKSSTELIYTCLQLFCSGLLVFCLPPVGRPAGKVSQRRLAKLIVASCSPISSVSSFANVFTASVITISICIAVYLINYPTSGECALRLLLLSQKRLSVCKPSRLRE